ncbi:MAG: hypothetical protein PHV28_06725 [Kiritimatiellae bacterium]|nr:hypothetical protein [Kiritimatiellia bacterium]
MKSFFWSVSLAALLAGGAGAARAQDFSKLTEPERKQVNGWLAERAEVLIDAHRLETEISQAWANAKYTSPEVEALRARYRELQHELGQTQLKLRKKVDEMPALQEKRRQLEEAQKKALELTKKVEKKAGGQP